MSNDAQKVQDVMLAIHTLWGAPALIIVILILLYQQVGWATFVGLGVALLYSPVSSECYVLGVMVTSTREVTKTACAGAYV